mgnify:CR=1 FL=1
MAEKKSETRNTITRRRMLAGTALATMVGSISLPGVNASAQTSSANDRPVIGAIGIGGRGSAILKEAARFGDVAAVCDVDLKHAEAARAAYDDKPEIYQDYRRMLERDDIDVVINGTPDHWHSKVIIDTCRAGKDLYTEKPFTLTIDEGKQVCGVVRETNRVVQVGTQQRSERQFQTAVELVRNGRVGKLRQVWVALPWYSTKGGPFKEAEVPDSLDWDMYQGQAPEHAYAPQRTHQTFRWFYMYAGGIVTDWGNHHVDIAQWGMDRETSGPTSVDARGLFPNAGAEDAFNTADRFFSRMKYDGGLEVLFFSAVNDKRTYGTEPCVPMSDDEVNWLFGNDVPEEIKTYDRNGIMFIGDQGRVFVNRGGIYGKSAEELTENPLPDDAWRVRPSADHMGNFFDCVKTRETPVSPVWIQHRTVTACHLTNISLRLNRPLNWDPVKECIVGDEEANGWLKRERREPWT